MAARPDLCKALDPRLIKRDFPIFTRRVHDKPLIYLDNAATTQRPQSVIDAVTEYYRHYNANVHRAVHTLSHEASVAYEEAHKKVARLVNARSWREIVFTRNATEAINLVAYAWGLHNLQPGDEILITIMEHHSDIVPWQMLRELKKIQLKFLDVTDEGRLKLDDLSQLLTKRTKLVGVIYASNVLGTINPVREIITEAQRVGAVTVVDAAQAAPHLPIDVQALGCDFLAVSGHKMLGPTGIGFLYGRRELLERMHPFLHGGDMISTVTTESVTFNELPWKFEAGTPHIAGGIGLGAAIDYLAALGLENIYAHEQKILEYALEKLLQINNLEIYGPKDTKDRLAVISFNLRGVHPHDVAGILDEAGIAVRSGHHCAQPLMRRLGMDNTARASFYIYNSEDDVDALVDALKTAQKLFA
ncbi:MAG: cysteine desulfurase [Candidatus Bipolaricaulota bacterium]|nr:cysteine desulfurase [Candidatus Bipolaricaulota bacterium]MCS7273945.1 cysteine desulfurase [Candidatus Bipolaricaulota bacterium]MDW8110440.1 cysteine desulfurase [Candidatus Bipolaricaulota bacterium]MDW8329859.1 cysteine desulfurase [Candidatus Bipolaricaulota bacterium]